jgi:hypothetical protein
MARLNRPLESKTLIDLRASAALEDWLTRFRENSRNDPAARFSDIAAILHYAHEAAKYATLSYPDYEPLEEAFETVGEMIADARTRALLESVDAGRVDLGRGKAA